MLLIFWTSFVFSIVFRVFLWNECYASPTWTFFAHCTLESQVHSLFECMIDTQNTFSPLALPIKCIVLIIPVSVIFLMETSVQSETWGFPGTSSMMSSNVISMYWQCFGYAYSQFRRVTTNLVSAMGLSCNFGIPRGFPEPNWHLRAKLCAVLLYWGIYQNLPMPWLRKLALFDSEKTESFYHGGLEGPGLFACTNSREQSCLLVYAKVSLSQKKKTEVTKMIRMYKWF